jgi:hypothetical protein
MLKSQRAAYVTLMLTLDVVVLLLAFMAAWAFRDSLVNFLIWAGGIVQYPVESMVRRARDLPKDSLYRIFFSPNPLVGFKNHLLIFYLAAPTWLFFLNAQGGYDPQTRRNARQHFALCAYAGMLGNCHDPYFPLSHQISGEPFIAPEFHVAWHQLSVHRPHCAVAPLAAARETTDSQSAGHRQSGSGAVLQ